MKKDLNFTPLRSGLALLFFLIFSFFIFLNRNSAPLNYISSFIQDIFSAPKKFFYKVKTDFYFSDGMTKQEIKKMREENRFLIEKQADYQKLLNDNTALRSQFENGKIQNQDLLPVSVVGFSGSFDFPGSLIISAGAEDNLMQGMPVVSDNNLVGILKAVSKNFSEVILPNNEDFNVVGKTLTNASRGIVSGKGDIIIFDHVIITDTISENDIVETAGESGKNVVIPPDIVIGKIIAVSKDENKPFQSSQIKSLLDYKRLSTVFVIKKNK